MFSTVSRSWSLLRQSWGVLRQDKELMIFPVLSSIACLLVLVSFAVPAALLVDWRGIAQQASAAGDQHETIQLASTPLQRALWTVLAFTYYFCNYFVIVFFNTALVSCAVIRFRGGDPTVRDGLNAAWDRLSIIAAWAVVAATVGTLLKALEERLGFLGKIVVGFLGMAWTVTTYFVVPVLAVEKLGPIDALKRSVSVLKATWGESLVGAVSLSAATQILALPGIFVLIGGVVLAAMAQSWVLAAVAVVFAVVYFIGLGIVSSTLSQVYLAGVYLYAAEGVVPAGFAEESLRGAFKRK